MQEAKVSNVTIRRAVNLPKLHVVKAIFEDFFSLPMNAWWATVVG